MNVLRFFYPESKHPKNRLPGKDPGDNNARLASKKLSASSTSEEATQKPVDPQLLVLSTSSHPIEAKAAGPRQIPSVKRRSPRLNVSDFAAQPSNTQLSSRPSGSSSTSQQVQEKIMQLLNPTTTETGEVSLVTQRLGQHLREQHEGPCSVPELAVTLSSALSRLGCRVLVRRVTDTKQYWSKNLGRTFVICTLPCSNGQVGCGLVIDPNFKDQFITPNMSQRYREIWSVLPDVFVGQASQLSPLLQLLCNELTVLFVSQGRQLPPWRALPATIGRWLSCSCFDLAVPPTAGPGAAAQVTKILASINSSAVGSGSSKGKVTGAGSVVVDARRCPVTRTTVSTVSGFCLQKETTA